MPKSDILTEGDEHIGPNTVHYYAKEISGTVPVVLIHGLGVSSRYMLPLARQLALVRTVYAIDLPGFGKSSKPEGVYGIAALANILQGFIKARQFHKPVLVGNSFGCQVVLKIIKDDPAIASRSVLIGPTMNKFERNYFKQIMRWLQNLRHEPTKKLGAILAQDIIECGPLRVFKTLRIGIQDRPEENLHNVQIPLLFMRGEHDPIAPPEWLEYLASHNPHFQTAELKGAGHALNFNSPKPLAQLINKFTLGQRLE